MWHTCNQISHGNVFLLLEQWANKSYSELQAEGVIMMMGMEDQLVRDTLVKYGLSKDKILPEEKKKLRAHPPVFLIGWPQSILF